MGRPKRAVQKRKKNPSPGAVRCYCGVGKNIFLCCFKSIKNLVSDHIYLSECEAIRKTHTKKKYFCLFPECKEKAIGSHTISQKDQLSKIATNGHVSKYAETDSFRQHLLAIPTDVDRVGVVNASRAPLFCNRHDGRLFHVLDNQSTLDGTGKELEAIFNLSCYRSICKELWEMRVRERILNDKRTLQNELQYVYSQCIKRGVGAADIYVAMQDTLEYHDFMLARTKKKIVMLNLQKNSIDTCFSEAGPKIEVDGDKVPILCHFFVQMNHTPVFASGTMRLFEEMLGDRYVPVPFSTIDTPYEDGRLTGYMLSFFNLAKNRDLSLESGVEAAEYVSTIKDYMSTFQALIDQAKQPPINPLSATAEGSLLISLIASISEVFFSENWHANLSDDERNWMHQASQIYPWMHKMKNKSVTYKDCLINGQKYTYQMQANFTMAIWVKDIQDEFASNAS